MFTEFFKFWQFVKHAHVEKSISTVMYYYLSLAILSLCGLYLYIYYQGCIGLSVLLSVWAGSRLVTDLPAITIVQSIGMIMIVRYSLLGSLDTIAKKVPEDINIRLGNIEDRVKELHMLAFGGLDTRKEAEQIKKKPKKVDS